MEHQEIIKQLIELEEYFEEGRKKAYNLRTQIENVDSSNPLQHEENEEAKLEKLLGKKVTTSEEKKDQDADVKE